MPNILKVTTPTTGYDNMNNVKANPELQNPVNVQGPVNPAKVVKPDARSDASGQQADLRFQFETNFDTFIQQLKNMPVLAEELPKLFNEFAGMTVESGMGSGFAAEVAEFLKMINVSPENIGSLLKSQVQSSVRYTGAFFALLRRVLSETQSVELKNGILNFLKKYTDMAEGGNILSDIRRDMSEIRQRMMPKAREQAEQLEQSMIYNTDNSGGTPEQKTENLRTLKSDLLPYLNSYISKIHDRGVLRDTVAHMADLTGRYENGQSEGVLKAFEKLFDYQTMQQYFQGFDIERLFDVLAGTEYEKAIRQNQEMGKLADIIKKGASGEAGTENTQAFMRIMEAIVLNESVYMPVLHIMMPVCVDGQMMFSEMWVDPDAEGNGGSEQDKESGSQRNIRGLVKFDIEDLGFFDMFFSYGRERVSMQINIPDGLEEDSRKIQEDIRRILSEHSIETEELVLGKSNISIPITEAFPRLRERKNSINVSV